MSHCINKNCRHQIPESVSVCPQCGGLQIDTASEDESPLRGLPIWFYAMAIICGVVMCIFTISFSSQLDSSEIGSLIGWTIGSCLAILWSGRVVELLQDMRDDGRDLTAIVRREVAQSEAEETLPHSWNEINAKYEE